MEDFVWIPADAPIKNRRWLNFCYRHRIPVVPPIFGIDLQSWFKSLWLGWWLISWRFDMGKVEEFHIAYCPNGD